MTNQPPQVICKALAGTGKTFTLVEGIKRRRGLLTDAIPSPEQAAIWDVINQGPMPDSICCCAFNKSAAKELDTRLDGVDGCDVITMHSMGFGAIKNAAEGRVKVNKWKTINNLAEHYNVDYKMLMKNKASVVNATDRLVQLSKYAAQTEPDDIFLDDMVDRYGVDVNEDIEEIYNNVSMVLRNAQHDYTTVDFDDMIWQPVVNNLPVEKYDLLMVDEGQDLNHCQQQLALRAGKRIVLVGDENQAIYGFAGADINSISTMRSDLRKRGSTIVLPLTVTRRCSHAVVAEACKIVPEFTAHPDNLDGSVSTIDANTYISRVSPGDMILCRVNAPLIQNAFALIGNGIPAEIIGKDLKAGLVGLVKKLRPNDADDLLGKLYAYEEREIQRIKKNPRHSQTAIIAIEDKCSCLRIFAREVDSISEVFTAIDSVFSQPKEAHVRLSSIHRSKGLEAQNVFVLHPELLPHPMAKADWEIRQERNLKYVAVTRAIENLYWIDEKEVE